MSESHPEHISKAKPVVEKYLKKLSELEISWQTPEIETMILQPHQWTLSTTVIPDMEKIYDIEREDGVNDESGNEVVGKEADSAQPKEGKEGEEQREDMSNEVDLEEGEIEDDAGQNAPFSTQQTSLDPPDPCSRGEGQIMPEGDVRSSKKRPMPQSFEEGGVIR